jgi:purine-binding chemotaxis protein CheW
MEQVKTRKELKQYLTFNLKDVEYAVDVSRVREVLEFSDITKLVGRVDFVRGVINLRGSVIPVMDLKLKFNMDKTEKTIDTCIIVLEVEYNSEIIVVGIMSDSVQEVVDISVDDIEPPPSIGTAIDVDFIKGMGKKDDKFIIIIDINKIFSESELSSLKTVSDKQEE